MGRQERNERLREEVKKQTSRRRKQKRKNKAAKIWLSIFAVLCTVGVILCLTVLFPIEEIRVTGQSQYTQEQIVSASGLELSQNLFLFSGSTISQQIEKELPYVESVAIKRILPGTVRIQVAPATEAFSYGIDGSYYVTNANGKVLRQTESPADETIEIIGVAATGVPPGDSLPLTDETNTLLMNDLVEWTNNHSLPVSQIDLSNNVNIALVIDGRIRVELGTQVDLVYKIAHMAEMVKNIGADDQGSIDLSAWTREKPQGFFREGEINPQSEK